MRLSYLLPRPKTPVPALEQEFGRPEGGPSGNLAARTDIVGTQGWGRFRFSKDPEPQAEARATLDQRAEERSEDDGMQEHPQKATDPQSWADHRVERAGRAPLAARRLWRLQRKGG